MMLRDFPYTNPNQAALDFAQSNHPELIMPTLTLPARMFRPGDVRWSLVDRVGRSTETL